MNYKQQLEQKILKEIQYLESSVRYDENRNKVRKIKIQELQTTEITYDKIKDMFNADRKKCIAEINLGFTYIVGEKKWIKQLIEFDSYGFIRGDLPEINFRLNKDLGLKVIIKLRNNKKMKHSELLKSMRSFFTEAEKWAKVQKRKIKKIDTLGKKYKYEKTFEECMKELEK
jgi:hypothetical protein